MSEPGILVVEEEALIAANIVENLSSSGNTVHEAVAKGEDAIRSVTEKKPDLVLMDIHLIGPMDGIETSEKIRAIADIPIVYLTANTDNLHLEQAESSSTFTGPASPYGGILV